MTIPLIISCDLGAEEDLKSKESGRSKSPTSSSTLALESFTTKTKSRQKSRPGHGHRKRGVSRSKSADEVYEGEHGSAPKRSSSTERERIHLSTSTSDDNGPRRERRTSQRREKHAQRESNKPTSHGISSSHGLSSSNHSRRSKDDQTPGHSSGNRASGISRQGSTRALRTQRSSRNLRSQRSSRSLLSQKSQHTAGSDRNGLGREHSSRSLLSQKSQRTAGSDTNGFGYEESNIDYGYEAQDGNSMLAHTRGRPSLRRNPSARRMTRRCSLELSRQTSLTNVVTDSKNRRTRSLEYRGGRRNKKNESKTEDHNTEAAEATTTEETTNYGYEDVTSTNDYDDEVTSTNDYGYEDTSPAIDYGYGDATPAIDYGYGDAAPTPKAVQEQCRKRIMKRRSSLDYRIMRAEKQEAMASLSGPKRPIRRASLGAVQRPDDEESSIHSISSSSSKRGSRLSNRPGTSCSPPSSGAQAAPRKRGPPVTQSKVSRRDTIETAFALDDEVSASEIQKDQGNTENSSPEFVQFSGDGGVFTSRGSIKKDEPEPEPARRRVSHLDRLDFLDEWREKDELDADEDLLLAAAKVFPNDRKSGVGKIGQYLTQLKWKK